MESYQSFITSSMENVLSSSLNVVYQKDLHMHMETQPAILTVLDHVYFHI